jgi:hypothetical protein
MLSTGQIVLDALAVDQQQSDLIVAHDFRAEDLKQALANLYAYAWIGCATKTARSLSGI